MTLPLRVSGDLRDVDSALLIRSLARSAETGRLAVSQGEVSRSLIFKTGRIVFAASNDADDGLGAALVRSGALSLEDLARLGAKVTPEQRLGAVLVEEGRLGTEQMVEAVVAQLASIVEAVVLAERGRYWFDFGDLNLRELIVLRADPRALVLGALRRVHSVRRVRRGLEQLAGRSWRPAPAASLAVLELQPAEERVLAALEPLWDGGALPPVAGLAPWDVARALWGLQVSGAVVPVSARRETPSPHCPVMTLPSAQFEVPPEEPPADAELEAALRDFNDRQQQLFRILRVEIGAGAEPFVRSCLARLDPEAGSLFEGIDFLPLGRFQTGPLLARLSERRTTDSGRTPLAVLLAVEIEAVVRMLGEERGRAVVQALGAIESPGSAAAASGSDSGRPAGPGSGVSRPA